jgi:hypothetical protein
MSQEKTLDFRTVVERANRNRRTSSVILGFLTWAAIVATTWLSLFALDNLLPCAFRLRSSGWSSPWVAFSSMSSGRCESAAVTS